MYSFACQKSTRKAPLFRGAGTNQGLLAPNNPNEVEKSPESGGVPAHRRYSDFGDFSICGAAADFRCILSRVPLDTWCCHGRHSYWSRTRGLTNSDGLRLLIFPQPLGEALKNQNAAPTTPPCFCRRQWSSSLHWADCLRCFAPPPCSNPPACVSLLFVQKKNARVFLHKRSLGGAKQPKSEPLPSGASLAAISSKVMVFVPSL